MIRLTNVLVVLGSITELLNFVFPGRAPRCGHRCCGHQQGARGQPTASVHPSGRQRAPHRPGDHRLRHGRRRRLPGGVAGTAQLVALRERAGIAKNPCCKLCRRSCRPLLVRNVRCVSRHASSTYSPPIIGDMSRTQTLSIKK